MQLPRVVIAAVFFVIGALIAVPALANAMSSPDETPNEARTTASGSPTASPSKSPSKSPSPSGSPSATPALPLRVTIGAVECPSRQVRITIRNTGPQNADYAIERNDGSEAVPGRIGAGASRTSTVQLREDRRTRIQVTYRNQPVETKTVTANCRRAEAAPAPTDSPEDELPRTGPDSALWARAATGGAAMITGLIILWYGGIWPRRREQVFAKRK
ncbi:hypothetical protein [Actinomadura sp. 21ATH]|uniref:hypothetical protein n=1 Tax=Actinomadura sp. 21ATH TaxID=1735444 RepID=UPI0035BEE305